MTMIITEIWRCVVPSPKKGGDCEVSVIRSEEQSMEKFANALFKNYLSSVNYLEQLIYSVLTSARNCNVFRTWLRHLCLILRRNISEADNRGSCLWLWLVVKRLLARVSAWKPVILTWGFRGFPLSLQGMLRPDQNTFYRVISSSSASRNLLTASWNTRQKMRGSSMWDGSW
jgi:hypothetical protein